MPIAAAVLLPDGHALESYLEHPLGRHVTLLPIHESSARRSGSNGSYPINVLRNMAIRTVRTTHFLVLDVDLWPSEDVYEAAIAVPDALLRRKYAALVVPAFQLDLPPPPHATDEESGRFFEASFALAPSTMATLKERLNSKRGLH